MTVTAAAVTVTAAPVTVTAASAVTATSATSAVTASAASAASAVTATHVSSVSAPSRSRVNAIVIRCRALERLQHVLDSAMALAKNLSGLRLGLCSRFVRGFVHVAITIVVPEHRASIAPLTVIFARRQDARLRLGKPASRAGAAGGPGPAGAGSV